MSRWLAWAWVALAWALWCSPAQAGSTGAVEWKNHILSSAYWVDVEGSATFDQARQQRHVPFENFLNGGYTNSVHWVRLTLAPSQTALGLRIMPAWLDEITLYRPDAPDQPRTVGDRYPAASNSFHGLGFSFELPASSEPHDVWLRLQSTSAHRLEVEALPVEQIPVANARSLIWAALYSASLVLILLVLLGVWFTQPDRVLGTFLFRHLVFTYFGTSYLGLPTLLFSGWFSPSFFDQMFSLAVIASLPVGLRFDMALLSTYGPNRPLLTALRWIAWAGVGVVVLFLAGQEQLALELNVQLMTLAVVAVFFTAWSCKPDSSVEQLMPKKAMMAYYTLLLGGLFLGLVGVLAWFKPSVWQAHILIYHGLASALVMSVMLFVRGQRQLARSRQVSWQLKQAQQEVEREQKRRQEQSQFLHMLMHELKTPLSVVSMALGTRDNKEHNLMLAGRAVQDMKAVIERCVQADRMAETPLEHRLDEVDVGAELQLLLQNQPRLQQRLLLSVTEGLTVNTDRQFLQTILSNLLDNATRYGDPVSPVDVELLESAQAGQAGLLVRVSNTPGLAGWPDPDKLFTKYYRASGAHRESGSGLGLFLAQQLAATLGGSLRYLPTDSLVRFELWLPQTPT